MIIAIGGPNSTLLTKLNNRGLGINAKTCLYDRVTVPTALDGAEIRGIRSAKKRTLNLLKKM